MNQLDTPQGSFEIERYPVQKKQPLQAWDAADLYLLNHLDEISAEIGENASVLILNDAFGALSLCLSSLHPYVMSDSRVSQMATINNFELNTLDIAAVSLLDSLHTLDKPFDLVVIKVPRTLALLEDQLYRIRPACHKHTRIIAAGMTKHIHTSTLKLFEQIIGATHTSLAWKKARLIFSEFDSTLAVGDSPYPTEYRLENSDGAVAGTYINHANVFSRDKLDIGSRFLLPHLPSSDKYNCIVDLACGNGVLGISAAHKNPQAKVIFTDESYMAVESARYNAVSLLGEQRDCEFLVTDGLYGLAEHSVDLIINNPPFHQNNVVGDFIAWNMFQQARRCLVKGGELIIVGNRHLGYHVKLKRLFGQVENIAANKKFVILKATRQ